MKTFVFSILRIAVIFIATSSATIAFGQELNFSEVRTQPTFSEYFLSFCCFVLIVPFIVEIFKSFIPKQKGGTNLVISWSLGILVALLSNIFNIGVFEHFSLKQSLALGFGASLACNGVFDTGIITLIVKFFKSSHI